ncbi:MAG: GAF domain-containing sensor histidine kinase [Thermoanaerobaculaceae bacterium]|nr:GAF domain-containing sensor histidine kinase [Thermoanaerobaculaceae bacterium]NLH11704.1 GAF domain-containing sensor histidine kinase [Holophagae bacterium]HPW56754.1 GAF domain-containing sensor histidine kinase [Thermoanaerobaculaceae bacterium]
MPARHVTPVAPQGDDDTWLPLMRSREFVASGRWLVNLRWLAGVGVIAGCWLARAVLPTPFSATPFVAVGAAILAGNSLLLLVVRRIEAAAGDSSRARAWLARAQVTLDWVAMLVLVHHSGGLKSPLLLFYIFHIVIAALLLPHREALTFTLTTIATLAGLGVAEILGTLPHQHLAVFGPSEPPPTPTFVAVMLVALVAVGLVAHYFTSLVARSVRRSEDQLAALYLASQSVTSTLDLQEVLQGLMRETVEVMGASGASIGLLDSSGTHIEPAASFGLSERYLAKGPLALIPGYIQTDVMTTGEPTFIHVDEDRDRLQYPDVVKAEGINTILYVRLPGKTHPLGLMRAYSNRPHAFSQDDARFLATIAAQGAGAIENALAFKALRQLDEEKSQFLRVVTHELRSPVKGAQAAVKVILDGYTGELGAQQRDFVTRIGRRLTALQLLVDDLLELAAGRSGLEVEERRPLSVVQALKLVVSQIEPQSVDKRQQLVLRCDDGCEAARVLGTPTCLLRILSNLVGNAVKYTPEGGRITITARRFERQMAVEVQDTGIGIPEASLPQLFTEFYRAPNAKDVETGTGLGLVIVKDMVDRLGGTLSVQSQEGHGSTFTVCLPTCAP